MVVIYVPEDKRWEQMGKGIGSLLGTFIASKATQSISSEISKMADDPQYTNNPTKLRSDIQAKYGPYGTQLYDKSIDAQAKLYTIEKEKLQIPLIKAQTGEAEERTRGLVESRAHTKAETTRLGLEEPYIQPGRAATVAKEKAQAEEARAKAAQAESERRTYEATFGAPPSEPETGAPPSPTQPLEPPSAPTTPGPPQPIMPSLTPPGAPGATPTPQVTSPPGGAPAPTGVAAGPAMPPTPPTPAPRPLIYPPGGGQPYQMPAPAPAPTAAPPAAAPPAAPGPAPAPTAEQPKVELPDGSYTRGGMHFTKEGSYIGPAAAAATPAPAVGGVPQAFGNTLAAQGITDPAEQLRVFNAGKAAGPTKSAAAVKSEIDKILQEHAVEGRQTKSEAAAAERQRQAEAAAQQRHKETLEQPRMLPDRIQSKLGNDNELLASIDRFMKPGVPTGGVMAFAKKWLAGKNLINDPEYTEMMVAGDQAVANAALGGSGFGGHWRGVQAEKINPNITHTGVTNVQMSEAIAERMMRGYATLYNQLKDIPGQAHNLPEISKVYNEYKRVYDDAGTLWWARDMDRQGKPTGNIHYYYRGAEVDRNLLPIQGAGTLISPSSVYFYRPKAESYTGQDILDKARKMGLVPSQMIAGAGWEKQQ